MIGGDAAGALLRRYVPGAALDDHAAAYEGAGTTGRRWPLTEQLGSVVALTDGTGAAIQINRYDEYGVPAATNAGRFGFTGQMWTPEAGGTYHYRARQYHSRLGRFLQPDPIGMATGLNLYAYVRNDPINLVDPLGLYPQLVRLCWGTDLPNGEVGVQMVCRWEYRDLAEPAYVQVATNVWEIAAGTAGVSSLPACPTRYVTLRFGANATGFLFTVGGNIGGGVQINVPLTGNLTGLQVGGYGTVGGRYGAGLYGAAGAEAGAGYARGPMAAGWSTSQDYAFDVAGGDILAGGIGGTMSADGSGGAVAAGHGRAGLGGGWMVGAGANGNLHYNFAPLNCVAR